MASDESMNMVVDEYDVVSDDGHQTHHNLSRLSMCTSSMYTNEEEDDVDVDVDEAMKMYMSRLSMESFDVDDDGGHDADEEFSDKGLPEEELLSSDDDGESPPQGYCYSLPATPPYRRRSHTGVVPQLKDYSSENELIQKGILRKRNLRRRRIVRERWMDSKFSSCCDQENNINFGNGYNSGGESGGGGGGSSGVVVITRPKGGKRSLCMDLDEMKACRDLGFELEMPSCRVSVSAASTLDTSSGGNSPIANWRISSPGDDPRDVKARLKVWAQAVALASASRPSTT